MKRNFLKNVAFGIFLGAELSLTLAFFLDTDVSAELKRLYTYIFSALASLLAASLALSGVLASIENQERIQSQIRERKFASARAFLPTALSNFIEISRNGILNCYSKTLAPTRGSEEDFLRRLESITLSDEIIEVFREILEHTESDPVSRRIALILRNYQIYYSRWRGISEHNVTGAKYIRQQAVAWAYLLALIESLFDFARDMADEPDDNITEETIRSALRRTLPVAVDTEAYDDAIGLCSRQFQRERCPYRA